MRAPGFNRLPNPGEETILSFLPHSCVIAQTIDIYYSMSIAGTLVFTDTDVLNNSQVCCGIVEIALYSYTYSIPIKILYMPTGSRKIYVLFLGLLRGYRRSPAYRVLRSSPHLRTSLSEAKRHETEHVR